MNDRLARTFTRASLSLFALVPLFAVANERLLTVDTGDNGLYEINTSTGARTFVATVTGAGIVGAMTYDASTDTLYASSTNNNALYKLNYNTGVATLIGSYGGPALMHAIAFENGSLYGATLFGDFYSINPLTGTASPEANWGSGRVGDFAYKASTNTTYAIDVLDDNLYSVNPATAARTLIGSTGTNEQVGVGLAYSPDKGLFAVDNDTQTFYSINESTGAASLIGSLGGTNDISLVFVGEQPVPEPASMAVLSLGVLACLRRRRRS